MRFMMMVKGDADYEAGKPPSEQLQAAMGEYIAKCAAEGSLVDAGGLLPTSQGLRASSRDGKISFTDGPFAEAKEIIGGYAVFELEDIGAAKRAMHDFMEVHHKAGVLDLDCDIRPMVG